MYELSTFDLSRLPVDWSTVKEEDVNNMLEKVNEDADEQRQELELFNKYIKPQLLNQSGGVNSTHKCSTASKDGKPLPPRRYLS